MKPLTAFTAPTVRYLFADIDGTITEKGQLRDQAYTAMWQLQRQGFHVIPVTGRPAGWCELIARLWPVDGVIGENGAFYFRYKDREMKRHFMVEEATRQEYRKKLDQIQSEVFQQVPEAGLASDQFCRLMDLAIDFCEDVSPLAAEDVQKIVQIFKRHGAQAKVSSIHVNGWFGSYDKLSMCRLFCERELGFELDNNQEACAFVGDSPNDEPMFSLFKNSFAVANVKDFTHQMKSLPAFVTDKEEGQGFAELADHLVKLAQ